MSDGYRWVTAGGEPAGPRHCTLDTAARWITRQPRRARSRPRPHRLMGETGPGRRRVLDAAERGQLVRLVARAGGTVPETVEHWLSAQARIVVERDRRRASLGLMTGAMRAQHPHSRRETA